MIFFEKELRKLFEKNNNFCDVKFIGKVCYGILGEKTRMRLEFVTCGTSGHYAAIRATVLDKADGQIDVLTLKFADIWGKKTIDNLYFEDGLVPYIWDYNGKIEWYVYWPTKVDYDKIVKAISEYAELFKD